MTGNNFLLDTNIVTAWFNNELALIDKINKAEHIYIPAIVYGELFYGAMYSSQIEKNIGNINKLRASYSSLDIDTETSLEYGRINPF